MVEVPKVFHPLYDTKKPIVIITGGRGGAKSFNSSLFISRVTYERNHVVMYCRYTMKSAEISIIPEIQKKLDMDGTVNDFTVNKSKIVNTHSGSVVLFRGIKTSSGNQTAHLKGIEGISIFVCDEGEEWRSEEDYDVLLGSVRSTKAQNMVMIIMNPCDVDHFIYQRYFKDHHTYRMIDGVPVQICTHPDVLHIHTTYLDNIDHVSDNFIMWVQRLKDEHLALPKEKQISSKYARLVMGRWADRRDGVVFEKWSIGDFDESLTYGYGLDYGYFPDPLAMVKVAIDQKAKKIYVKEELYQTKLSDEDILNHLKDNVDRRSLIVCDVNEERTTDKIRRSRYNIQKAAKGKNSIAADIRAMEDYELIIDKDSKNVITELNNYVWNDKKASIPIDKYNHAMDAIRYIFRRLLTPRVSASYG